MATQKLSSCHFVVSTPLLFFLFNFMYLILAVLGLPCCPGFSLAVASGGLLSSCTAWAYCSASLVGEDRLQSVQASVVVAHGLSSCGSQALEHRPNSCGTWAQLRCSTWDLPGPGTEFVSPAESLPLSHPLLVNLTSMIIAQLFLLQNVICNHMVCTIMCDFSPHDISEIHPCC